MADRSRGRDTVLRHVQDGCGDVDNGSDGDPDECVTNDDDVARDEGKLIITECYYYLVHVLYTKQNDINIK